MTGWQLQKLLDAAGLSQRAAAREIEINERTMRKYVSGESRIPKTVEYAVRWVHKGKQKMSKNVIAVWPDTASEPGVLSWIVSRDTLDADMAADVTDTVKTFDVESEAISFGHELARKESKLLVVSQMTEDQITSLARSQA
jgi:hypothetical protein